MEENKFDRLERLFEDYKKHESTWLKNFSEGIYDEKWAANLPSIQDTFAMYHYFMDNDIVKTKQSFYKRGRVKVFLTEKFDNNWLDIDIVTFSHIMLCDNKELIERFSTLVYKNNLGRSYMEAVNKGYSTPMYIIQCLISENWAEYERVMPIFKDKFLKRNKAMSIDCIFYEAIANKDKKGAEDAINELLVPKVHKYRNKYQIYNDFVSYPAIGYAKLAWYKGLEVDINSPYVPKDLLPILPLRQEEYVDYDFIKNYFAGAGSSL